MFDTIGTEPNARLAYDLGSEHHKPTMSTLGGHRGRLEKERQRSPFHSCALSLFDFFNHKFHWCVTDNLYMSLKFDSFYLKHEKKVIIVGVTWKGHQVLPECVLQNGKTPLTEKQRVCVTTKDEVLNGGPQGPNLVILSVYDQKPVHFLSWFCTEINYIYKSKFIYPKEDKRMNEIYLLRLNVNNHHKNEMVNVDVSEQLQNYLQLNNWMRKTKWWWYIFLGGWGTTCQITCLIQDLHTVLRRETTGYPLSVWIPEEYLPCLHQAILELEMVVIWENDKAGPLAPVAIKKSNGTEKE